MGRVVSNHQVQIIIKTGCPASKGLGPVRVREHIVPVPVPLRDRKGGMQGHPVEEIGTLTQPAPHPGHHLTVAQQHPLHITLSAAWVPDASPVGEGLTGKERHSIQPRHGQTQVFHLVLLHPHVHILEPAHQRGGVGRAPIGTRGIRTPAGKGHAAQPPPDPSAGTKIPGPQPQPQRSAPDRHRRHPFPHHSPLLFFSKKRF